MKRTHSIGRLFVVGIVLIAALEGSSRGHPSDSFSMKAAMSAGDFEAWGLTKLTAAELAALGRWIAPRISAQPPASLLTDSLVPSMAAPQKSGAPGSSQQVVIGGSS